MINCDAQRKKALAKIIYVQFYKPSGIYFENINMIGTNLGPFSVYRCQFASVIIHIFEIILAYVNTTVSL